MKVNISREATYLIHDALNKNLPVPELRTKVVHSHVLALEALNFGILMPHIKFTMPSFPTGKSTSTYWEVKLYDLGIITVTSLKTGN
jgi:hypothetical protein